MKWNASPPGGLLESLDGGDVLPNILGEEPYLRISVDFHTYFKDFWETKPVELLRN